MINTKAGKLEVRPVEGQPLLWGIYIEEGGEFKLRKIVAGANGCSVCEKPEVLENHLLKTIEENPLVLENIVKCGRLLYDFLDKVDVILTTPTSELGFADHVYLFGVSGKEVEILKSNVTAVANMPVHSFFALMVGATIPDHGRVLKLKRVENTEGHFHLVADQYQAQKGEVVTSESTYYVDPLDWSFPRRM